MKKQPHVYIIAGSNGSGKTTFALEYIPKYAGQVDFINADLIARGLSPLDADKMAFRASRIFLDRIREVSESKIDFAFETTLSGRAYVHALRKMKDLGYQITMFYLWIPNYHLAIRRIKGRVLEGGHNVPESIVRRRFTRTLKNLFHVYYPVIDRLVIFDNSLREPHMVFEKTEGGTRRLDPDLCDKIMSEVDWNEKEI